MKQKIRPLQTLDPQIETILPLLASQGPGVYGINLYWKAVNQSNTKVDKLNSVLISFDNGLDVKANQGAGGRSDLRVWQIILLTIRELTRANQGRGHRVTGSDRWTALEAIQSKRKIWTALASSSFFPQFLSYFLSTMSSSSSLSSSLSSSSSPSSSFSKQLPAASFVHPALLHWWRVFLSLTTTRMLLIGGLTQNYFLFVCFAPAALVPVVESDS